MCPCTCLPLGKPSQNPVEQVRRQFDARFTAVRPDITTPAADLDICRDLREALSWLAGRELDVKILESLLELGDQLTVPPLSCAFMAQTKLIATVAEMTPCMIMKAFIDESLSRASFLPGLDMK